MTKRTRRDIEWTDKLVDTIVAAYVEDRLSGMEICEKFDIPTRAIYRVLQREGIPLRPTGTGNAGYGGGTKVLAGEITSVLWRRITESAKSRRIPVIITPQEAWDVAVEQNMKCYYTGRDITFPKCSADLKRGRATASLDRTDSCGVYERGNVRWIHKDLQRFKNNLNEDTFLTLCAKVVVHRIMNASPK